MKQQRRWWSTRVACVLAAVIVGRLVSAAPADEDVWPVEKLNAAKERWSDWIDQPRKIEGRVSAVSKFQFRMLHCDLAFHVSEEQSRIAGNARNIEVSGRIKKDKSTGKLLFAVERMKVLPGDVDQYESREAKLKSAKPRDWYDLAEWAAARGKFYNDEDLSAKARRAWLKGMQLERANLPADDPEARFALAKRLESLQLDKALHAELLHEGARLKWRAIADDRAQQREFAEWLTEVFPDGAVALKEIPAALEQRYQTDPLKVFREADDATRAILQRIFVIQVELAEILPAADADGKNALQIAGLLSARIPERTDLIKKYQEAAFQYQLTAVATATRPEALKLSDELKTRGQEHEARELLRSWIRAREPRLRKDGPIGLMQLADDYLQLVADEPAAVKMLAEAHRLDPSLEDASVRLKQLGYRFEQNDWVKGDSIPETSDSGKGAGQLFVGMTSAQVLSLLGTPASRSRVLSHSGLHEVWSFGHRGTSRLLIHLHGASANATPRVTRYVVEN